LNHILCADDLKHVILIDDARSFGISEDYPTIQELKNFILSLRKNVKILNADDIIRVVPE